MPEDMDPILKAALYLVFFLLFVFILVAAIATISYRAASHIEAAAKSIVLAWHSRGKSLLRKHLPVFFAGYAITAGVAIVLGRFDADAALLGCPAVAAGISYLVNRLRRTE